MKRQAVLLFNNRTYFKRRAEKFLEKQLKKRTAWKNVQITCVDNFIDFSRALESHPDLVVITYDKGLKQDSRFFEERILSHVRNEVPEAKTVVITKNFKKLHRLFSDPFTDIRANGENVLQQMFSVLQDHMASVKQTNMELSEQRYYRTRFGN